MWDSLHWQKKLEESKVCLLNCGPTGCETVKNLVLGGIASFTLVDKDTVKPRDLGNNFMLSTNLADIESYHYVLHVHHDNFKITFDARRFVTFPIQFSISSFSDLKGHTRSSSNEENLK